MTKLAAHPDRLTHYLGAQRWFSGDADQIQVVAVEQLPWLSETSEPLVRVELVSIEAGRRPLTYQVPLAYYREQQDHLEHASVGVFDDAEHGRLFGYDALRDKDAVMALMRGFESPGEHGGLSFRTLGPVRLDEAAAPVVLTAEQSNTSVIVGDDLLLKVFRKVEAGRNPDIEVHDVLTRAGSDVVAPLRGWIQAGQPAEGAGYDLGMLQEFLRTATDGWDYARHSVRDLFNEGDLYAYEVGGDFAGESERLGEVTARMHVALAQSLTTAVWDRADLAALVVRLDGRLDAAVAAVPELSDRRSALAEAYRALDGLEAPVPVQRVHGDLHLGQTLRTVDGWRIIDFEGEPATPLTDRVALDSPMRDVSGMLRSFEYAAHSVSPPMGDDNQLAHRAAEWSERNRDAFCTGYAAESGTDLDAVQPLLRAYEIDKAVYEVVYEVHHRPTWAEIPMRAVDRLAG
ncbi:MAG: maltokinase N-terminal cap-like domain-containing protein [Nocardioidaceae bacterium]